MKLRLAILLVAAVLCHFAATLWLNRLHARSAQLQIQRASEERRIEITAQRLNLEKGKLLAGPGAAHAARSGPSKAKSGAAKPASAALLLKTNSELRQKSIRAYVDQQHLAYAGLLAKLHFSAGQVRQFDSIQADTQARMIDLAASSGGRPDPEAVAQLKERETEAYQALFGPAYDQWAQAVQDVGPRQIVSQWMQQSLQGTGSVSGATADQLTAILSQNRASTGPDYDWDSILAQAKTVLSPEQMATFANSVVYYRVQKQMLAARQAAESAASASPPRG